MRQLAFEFGNACRVGREKQHLQAYLRERGD